MVAARPRAFLHSEPAGLSRRDKPGGSPKRVTLDRALGKKQLAP